MWNFFVHLLSLQVPSAGSGSFTSARTLPLHLLIFWVFGEEFLRCGGGTTSLHTHGEFTGGESNYYLVCSLLSRCIVFVVLTGLNVAGFAQCICRLESTTKITRNSSNVGRSQLDDVREGMRSSRQSIMLPARNSLPKCSHDLEGTS